MAGLGRKVLIVKPEDNYFFPIGYSYLLAAWEKEDIKYDYVDMYLYPDFDIEGLLRKNDYLAVCSGGLLWSLPFFKKLFDVIKSVKPTIACILGGNITQDFSRKELFSYTNVDYLVIGEGEITSVQLLRHIQENGISPTLLLGVSYRCNSQLNGFADNKRRPPLDLATTNWQPTWSFLEVEKYTYVKKLNKHFFPVITGRGCTGRCAFCSPTNGRYRERPIPYIMEEIETILSKYNFDYFDFLNEVFFQKEDHVNEFCKKYSQLAGNKPWRCLQRVDTSPKVLDSMKKAGCFTVNVGLESGSDRILKAIKKDITTEQARTFIAALKAVDIKIDATFMFGNYDETPQDIAMTVDFLLEQKALGPMALCITYPGTLNYLRARNRGLIDNDLTYALSIHDAYNSNYLQHMEAYFSGQRNYINITAMPDELLFETVANEMRRLHVHGCRYKNVVSQTTDGRSYRLRGECPVCGASNERTVYIDDTLSFMEHQCVACCEEDASFSALEIPEIKSSYDKIKNNLQEKQRTVIAGNRTQLYFFIKNGFLDFNYSNIIGFIFTNEGNPLPKEQRYIGNIPHISIDAINEHNVETIVALGAGIEDTVENLGIASISGDNLPNLNIYSLFPWGKLGREISFNSLKQGKALVVSSARNDIVTTLLDDLHTLGCISVSLLLQADNVFPHATRVRQHRCDSIIFDYNKISAIEQNTLRNEHYDFVVFPFSIDIGFYRNILECAKVLGVQSVYGYHSNNIHVPFDDKVVVTAPFHAYMETLA